jgi:hypothetical protein
VALLQTAAGCGPDRLAKDIMDDKDELQFVAIRRLRAKVLRFARALLPAGCRILTAADAWD